MQGCVRSILLAVVATFFAVAAFLGGFGFSTGQNGQSPIAVVRSVLPGNSTASTPPEFGVFWEAWNIIHKDFYGAIPDNKTLTYGAIRGALKLLNDPHTVFIEPRGTQQQNEQLRGDFEGIGAQVNQVQDNVVIVAPIPGSPAEKAGIKAGDIILKVNDQDVKGKSVDDVVALIRGPKGTQVKVTVMRVGQDQPLVFTITRAKIDLPSVVWRMEENNIGYVHLNIFGEKSKDEIVNAVKDLKSKGAKALIFDLRDNPGGYLQSAIDVASQFIKDGAVAYERDKSGREQQFNAAGNGIWTEGPLVVLINKGSASASEITSGAIQDRKRAILLGDTSFGKGSVQAVHELSDKSSIHVTIAEWLTPNKRQISGKGLTPDVAIPISPDDQKAGNDTQLKQAIQYLKEHMQ